MGQSINILYILQQSIYNKEGKWLTADSNINMMVGIVNQLTKYNPNLHVFVLIGEKDTFADLNSYDEIMKDPQVTFVPYPFVVDAFLNRQHFDVNAFDIVMRQLPRIDIVWSNITEQSRNIKTYLHYKRLDAKLITCCYWLDTPYIGEPKVPAEISYQWRQFDGMECSDLCVFTCESTKNAFFENAALVFNKYFVKNIRKKSVIWDFGYSEIEALNYNAPMKADKHIILFLNRLSDINYTHHHEFISAVNELYEQRQDFEVVFTNPSQKADWKSLSKLIIPLRIINHGMPLNREDYFKVLWNSTISFHGYTLERYGGCAHRESIYCRNITITPKVFEYERIQGKKYPFYVKNDFSNLTEVMNKALNWSKEYIYSGDAKAIRLRNHQSSFECVVVNVQNDIKRFLGIEI